MHLFELLAQAIYGLPEIVSDKKADKKTYILRALLVVTLFLLILAPFLYFFLF